MGKIFKLCFFVFSHRIDGDDAIDTLDETKTFVSEASTVSVGAGGGGGSNGANNGADYGATAAAH